MHCKSEMISCHQTCNFKYILVIYISWTLPVILPNCYQYQSPTFIEAILMITPANVDQCLGRRFQSVTKEFSFKECLHMIWQGNYRLVAMRYSMVSFEIPTRYLHFIAYFVSLRKGLWNYEEGLINLCEITLSNGYYYYDHGYVKEKIRGWAPDLRHPDAWPHEVLTTWRWYFGHINKLHSCQLAEISWKGELDRNQFLWMS